MRQRVVIAIALACHPELIIADEPTTALDVTVQAQILSLLKDLQAEMGSSSILITHDLGVIAQSCDSVVVMYAGRVVEKAPVRELLPIPAMLTPRDCWPPSSAKFRAENQTAHHSRSGGLYCGFRSRMPLLPKAGRARGRTHGTPSLVEISPTTSWKPAPLRQPLTSFSTSHAGTSLASRQFENVLPRPLRNFPAASGWVKAVDDVSFNIYPGETLGLVGNPAAENQLLAKALSAC